MIASTREYLITRYGPELTSTLAQLNRLAATLDEVATKVPVAMSKACRTVAPGTEGKRRASAASKA